MSSVAEIIDYIAKSLLSVFSLMIILRFVLQWVRADFYNPISQGIVKFTAPVLKPLRRLIPGFWGLDIAALTLAFLVNALTIVISISLKANNPLQFLDIIAAVSFLKILASLLNIASLCVLVSIILSFVAPMSAHPAATLVNQIAEPLMAPFRKMLPDMGGLDLSPILLFLVLGVLTKIFALIAASLGIPSAQMWMFVFV
jgi:YggT family protein